MTMTLTPTRRYILEFLRDNGTCCQRYLTTGSVMVPLRGGDTSDRIDPAALTRTLRNLGRAGLVEPVYGTEYTITPAGLAALEAAR